jgi:hypothetical protein
MADSGADSEEKEALIRAHGIKKRLSIRVYI